MAGSPPLSRSRRPRYSTPAPTLSIALLGLSWRSARFFCTQSHVPGSTCITPRALALETMALLKPLSCQAIAEARPAGTPLRLATAAMSADETRPGVGAGEAGATAVGAALVVGTGAPVGSLSALPASSTP